jgi:hypothetical protein
MFDDYKRLVIDSDQWVGKQQNKQQKSITYLSGNQPTKQLHVFADPQGRITQPRMPQGELGFGHRD